MRLSFDTIEEVEAFMSRIKKTRTKGDKDEGAETGGQTAPEPLKPPPAGGSTAFAPQGASGFAPQGGATAFAPPPGGGINAVPPEVVAAVAKIKTAVKGHIDGGRGTADSVATWFKTQLDASAAAYNLDQIFDHALPKMTMPALQNIGKMLGLTDI